MPRLDPRLKEIVQSVNGVIQDRAIRHAVYLERFKSHEVRKILALLNGDVLPDLLIQLQRRLPNIATTGHDSSVYSTQRLRYLTRATRDVLYTGARQMYDEMKKDLVGLAKFEAEFQKSMLAQSVPVTVDFVTPNAQLLRSIVTSRPMQGQLLSTWAKGIGISAQRNVMKALNIGIAEGETIDQMTRRIFGTKAAGYADGLVSFRFRRDAEAVVRTAVNHVVTQARQETYNQNSDFVKGWQFVATLDARTTEICASLDGKTFPLDQGPYPPRHWNCRSTTAPIVKSWREMGIPLDEMPAGTRASMNGQVPATTTYPEWLRQQPKEVVYEVLGKGKGDLFLSGKVPIDRFVDARGQSLSLKAVARREGIKLEALKR